MTSDDNDVPADTGTYEDVLKYIYNLERMGIKLGLKNIRHLLKEMGNPETKYKIIHIGGTNGKGSTAAMVSSILREAGYTVGLFTSPHLLRYEERFQVNGECIAPHEVVKIFNGMKPVLDRMRTGESGVEHPTFFEMTTAIAFQFFRDREVDFAVMEVGLGGRLDATNAPFEKAVCAITTISKDHTQYLGDDLKTIAFEKAGIITDNTPVVVGVDREKNDEAFWVIGRIAAERSCFLMSVGQTEEDTIAYRVPQSDPTGITVDYMLGGEHVLYGIRIPFMGDYQARNAGIAMGIIQCLIEDEHIPEGRIETPLVKKALMKTEWPGRADQRRFLEHDWLFDTAHNPEALGMVKQVLEKNFAGREKVLLFGVMEDKDYRLPLLALAPLFRKVVLCRPNIPRSEDPEKIEKLIIGSKLLAGDDVAVVEDCAAAAKKAAELAGEGDLIVNTGSIFCVSEVLNHLKDQ